MHNHLDFLLWYPACVRAHGVLDISACIHPTLDRTYEASLFPMCNLVADVS